MRTARPVGLSQDGRSLVIATDQGDELAIPVDDRLHAALRGDRPRLGQLEIEMDDAPLGPRDIQARIRAGQSVAEVSRVAGMPPDRVERFAGPVLAERSHVAVLAMGSSVRRRGETAGHRNLRLAVTERLLKRGVDIDDVDWDAYRMEDGRWSVTASYRSGESARQAVFWFDQRARFSVAGDDEARWVLGEQSPVKGPQPGRRRPEFEPDTEATLDLSDELALVRVVQPPPETSPSLADDDATEPEAVDADGTPVDAEPTVHNLRRLRPGDRFPQQPAEEKLSSEPEPPSPLETLAEILDDQQDAPAVYAGLSDASAVPETQLTGGWEPGIVVDYPVEPSPEENSPEENSPEENSPEENSPEANSPEEKSSPEDETRPPAGPVETSLTDQAVAYQGVANEQADGVRPTPADPARPPDGGTDTPAPPDHIVDGSGRAEEAEEFEREHSPKPVRPAAKRKRASVPSWDEIMFGGPAKPS